MDNKKKYWLWLLVLAVVVVLVVALKKGGSDEEDAVERFSDADFVAQEGEVLVEGEIICLPLKSGEKSPEETCVRGFEGEDGTVFALNTTAIGGGESELDIGEEARVVGVFEPANTASQESSVFEYDGVLVVRAME